MKKVALSKKYSLNVASRFPDYHLNIHKVKDDGHNEGPLISYINKDDVYGFFWLGYRNTNDNIFIGDPLASDRKDAARIPSDGSFPGNSDYLVNRDSYISDLGENGFIGFGWIFYDEDCGTYFSSSYYDSLIVHIDKMAKDSLITKWNLNLYFSLAADVLRVALDLCRANEDDYLGEGSYLAGPGIKNEYWIGPKNDLKGQDFSNTITYPYYTPIYRWHYYQQKNKDMNFFFKTILY